MIPSWVTTVAMPVGLVVFLAAIGMHQSQKAGQWKQSADHLANLVAEQARENQRQQRLLKHHLYEQQKLQRAYEKADADLKEVLRDSGLDSCYVPVSVRVQLNTGFSTQNSGPAAPDRTN